MDGYTSTNASTRLYISYEIHMNCVDSSYDVDVSASVVVVVVILTKFNYF